MKIENIKKTRSQKEETRKIAVNLITKGWLKKTEIARILWVSYQSVVKRHNAFKKWGKKGLSAWKNKGWRPKKADENLTNQEEKILEKVISKSPNETKQLWLDFGLWTIKIMQEVVKKLFQKELKYRKIKAFLDKIWYTNQKPIFKAYQQNPEKVKTRVEEELPKILTEAELENREVFYWDESWFKANDHRWCTRSKKWKTPIVTSTWMRFGVSAISIISWRGNLRFMVYEWGFTSDTLIKFLQRLVRWNQKKYTIILDWHPTHKSKKVQLFLESQDMRIKLYYLPWYSPELNPDELLRNCVKCDIKWTIFRSKKELCAKLASSLHKHQKQKDKIQSFFNHKLST